MVSLVQGSINRKTIDVSRFVFAFFTGLLLLLQFTPDGFSAYFSMYVSNPWLRSGYLLYAALIYLFLRYSIALFSKGQIFTGGLQLLGVVLLIGVMVCPFDSVDHVSLLPFLAALQPIVLYCDYHFGGCDDAHNARGILRGIILLLVVSPMIFGLMFFPVVEKILIYFFTTLLYHRLQFKMKTVDG